MGSPVNTLYIRQKAARECMLDAGCGAYAPQPAMSLAKDLAVLRKQVK